MKTLPFYELQKFNPFRRPSWRWDRANDLVSSGRYFSAKRDDRATGIAIAYLRDMARCASELRLHRVRDRYEHVDRAKRIWEEGCRLEIETRILARQSDVEIGLEMDLPAATVQGCRDLFFDVDDRIDGRSYILFQVVGIHPCRPPQPVALMQLSAYMHGPAVIEPWLQFLRGDQSASDLTTEAGRLLANIDFFVAAQALPDSAETHRSLLKTASILLRDGFKFSKIVSAQKAFFASTYNITAGLDLPAAVVPPFSYAPACQDQVTERSGDRVWRDRRAA